MTGGDRLERIRREISRKQTEQKERRERAGRYEEVALALGLAGPVDEAVFARNQRAAAIEQETASARQAEAQNARTDAEVGFRRLRSEHQEIGAELESLRSRRSNIPARVLRLRTSLCEWLGDVGEEALPFAGELIQVREEERDWEGAIERLLHSFARAMARTLSCPRETRCGRVARRPSRRGCCLP